MLTTFTMPTSAALFVQFLVYLLAAFDDHKIGRSMGINRAEGQPEPKGITEFASAGLVKAVIGSS